MSNAIRPKTSTWRPLPRAPAPVLGRSNERGERGTRLTIDGRAFGCDGARIRLQGVTYGPFAPDSNGCHFPAIETVGRDLSQMVGLGINAIRTYHMPPDWFVEAACDRSGLTLFIDVPWSKHICFLDSAAAQAEARAAVRAAARLGRDYAGPFIYSIGNEIPPDVVRWHGAGRIERFLGELVDVAHQTDPTGLATYANYPPTEYLELPQLDFATFNVYLHELETFRRYLLRLQNLVGDKPLVLGELGMDTLGHGELAQADFLGGHLREATLLGVAGAFAVRWADDCS